MATRATTISPQRSGRRQIKLRRLRSAIAMEISKPQDGLACAARGRIDVYEARADIKCWRKPSMPQGLGALQLAFDNSSGRWARKVVRPRQQVVPARIPRRIGIVTSPRGPPSGD